MTHPALITDDEFSEFLQHVSQGLTNETAAKAAGYSFTPIRRRLEVVPEWEARFQEAREARASLMADRVDRRLDELALEEKPQPSLVLAWAKRWNDAYRDKTTVETTVSGSLEMRTPEVVEAIERFTASVVQAASQVGARKPARELDAGSNGSAGLPVGRVDGKA